MACNKIPSASYRQIKKYGDSLEKTAVSIFRSFHDDNMKVSLLAHSTIINFEFTDADELQGPIAADETKPFEKIVSTIAKMNSSKTSEELLQACENNPATISAYKNFVQCLASGAKKNSVAAIAATPGSETPRFLEISQSSAPSILSNIELAEKNVAKVTSSEIFNVSGTLVGLLSKENKRFQFCPEGKTNKNLPDLIKGLADDSIFTDDPKFVLNHGRYQAQIRKTVDSSLLRKKTHWVLLSLCPLESTIN